MDDLITWLVAQLDAIEGNICPHPRQCGRAFHTADEGWLLDDIKAKRRILDLHGPHELRPWECRTCAGPHGDDGYHIPCPTVRLVALPYAVWPGYRDEWRP